MSADSFGSGIHQSRIGMYAPAFDDSRTFEAAQVYLGDLDLFQGDDGGVSVQVVEANDAAMTLSFGEVLGRLAIEEQDGEINLTLHLNEDLSDEVRQKLVTSAE